MSCLEVSLERTPEVRLNFCKSRSTTDIQMFIDNGERALPSLLLDSTDWPSMPVVYYNTSVEFRMAQDTAYRYVLLFSDFYDDDRNWYLGTNLIKDSVSST